MQLAERTRWLALAVLVGCAPAAAPPPAPRPPAPPATPRRVTPLAGVPDYVVQYLPAHGIYVDIGGEEGSETIALDRETGRLRVRLAHEGRPPAISERALPRREVDRLWSLAEAAWREPPPPAHERVLDFDELLAMRDGNDAFYLDGGGKITPPAAAELVEAMAKAAR
ncbi:MAG TPA: hypothetical protein VLX92_00805 [Kofleriaceae bacterium]|nr:hypothetical protein [Kofleriaceae bacterium]